MNEFSLNLEQQSDDVAKKLNQGFLTPQILNYQNLLSHFLHLTAASTWISSNFGANVL